MYVDIYICMFIPRVHRQRGSFPRMMVYIYMYIYM